MEKLRVPKTIPTWLGSAVLLAVAVFAIGCIYAADQSTGTTPHTFATANPSKTEVLLASAKVATSSTSEATTTKVLATKTSSAAQISTTTVAAQELAGSGANLLKSLVNIVCLSSDPSIPSISGSGVVIDSRGIILTAAHVAQMFLLQDYLGQNTVTCLVRDGSPARRAYTAEPIYVSPSWIKDNPDTLETSSPVGTGQNDFAFLAITGTATSTPVPSYFSATPLSQADPQLNEQVAIGSYGAEYLTGSELNYSLYPILVFGTVTDRYTFGTNTVDLISVQGSAASQEGSSGGALVDASGNLIGTITTSSVSGTIASRQLNAITPNYMRRSFEADMGVNMDSYIADNSVSTLITNFKNEASVLASMIKY